MIIVRYTASCIIETDGISILIQIISFMCIRHSLLVWVALKDMISNHQQQLSRKQYSLLRLDLFGTYEIRVSLQSLCVGKLNS